MPSSVIELQVNGEPQEFLAQPGATLLSALRESLGLTAAKRGCGQGTCGSCTCPLAGGGGGEGEGGWGAVPGGGGGGEGPPGAGGDDNRPARPPAGGHDPGRWLLAA